MKVGKWWEAFPAPLIYQPYTAIHSSGQKPQNGLMTLAYQCFTAVFLLIYGSLFLTGVYYCLSVFWCAVVRVSKFFVRLGKNGSEIREILMQVYGDNANSLQVGDKFFWGKSKCH
jgi:hypothetical protein